MVREHGKLIVAVLLTSFLCLSLGLREAEATSVVTLTSGTITGYTALGAIDVAGPEFALTGTVNILDLVGVTDCISCQPGQLFNSFWTFDLVLTGTLTWQQVEHTLVHEAVHGVMSGAGYLLPATLAPVFSVDLPFTLSITMDGFDLVASGLGVLPVTFSPNHEGEAWVRTGHSYFVGASVPAPNSGWLLLGGLPALVGIGWLVRRTRQAGTLTTGRD